MEKFNTEKGVINFYTINEVAEALHAKRWFVYSLIKRGLLVARKMWPRQEWVVSEQEYLRVKEITERVFTA